MSSYARNVMQNGWSRSKVNQVFYSMGKSILMVPVCKSVDGETRPKHLR